MFDKSHFLNNSKFFAGVVMIMLNIGSKYVTIELSKNQEQYLKNNIGRQILIFAISWMGSRDVLIALALTAIFTVLADHLFNEQSKFCIIPRKYRRYEHLLDLDKNNEITLDMFFDSENYSLKIKYLSTEIINTNFGKILCHKIKPYVQSGRVFKKDESLTMWISADNNRIPMKIKADLIVGSIRIDLEAFSNLNHPFEIKFD